MVINKRKSSNKSQKSSLRQNIEALLVILPLVFLIRTFGFGLYVVPTCSMETTMLVGERFVADKFTVWFTDIKYGDIISFNDPRYPYSDNKLVRLWQRWVWGPSNWTKRVVGKPGDHIKGVIENGQPVIYRNGVKLDEPYINKYPIIGVFKVDPQILRSMSREALNRYVQGTDIWSLKSYDPTKAWNDQPFYRINPNWIVPADPVTQEPLIRYPGVPDEDGKDEYEVKLGPDEYWALGDNRRGSLDSRFWGPLKAEHIHGKIVFRLWSLDSDEGWWIVDLLKHPIDFWYRIRWSRCLQRVF